MTMIIEPRAEYTLQLPDVVRNRAAAAGEREVKRQRTTFLPPLASMCCSVSTNEDGEQVYNQHPELTLEGTAAYNKMLSQASFYGATGMTLEGLIGLIFAKKAVQEIPASIEFMNDNVDGRGGSLRDLAKKTVREILLTPRSGILVARPSTVNGTSKLEVERQNLRPKLMHYRFEDIITWDYGVINNVEKLSFIVLREVVTVRTEFKIENEYQYRVLELIDNVYHQSVLGDGGGVITPAMPVMVNGNKVDTIPFYLDDKGLEGKPALNELVDMNFHHYQVSADYNSKNHFSSFVIWYETGGGSSRQNMMMGNGVKWSNENESATFGVLQADGNADALRISLQDDEQRMAALGAEALRPRGSGVESAEAKSLDKVAQNSTTADAAITASEMIVKALNFASLWMGGTEDAVYTLNTDYNPAGMSAQDQLALFTQYQGQGISFQTYYENLQRGEVGNVERTWEDEKALIQNAGTGMDE
jgi:hypothetical protein